MFNQHQVPQHLSHPKKSVHSIFPVSGKNNPIRVYDVLKSLNLDLTSKIFDPGCFSGTIGIEANLQGYTAFNSDISRLAIIMTETKTKALQGTIEDLHLFIELSKTIEDSKQLNYSSYDEVIRISNNKLASHLLALACINLIGYKKRGGRNKSFQDQIRHIVDEYYTILSSFYKYRDSNKINIGKSKTFIADARTQILKNNSIDIILFSPPYMDTIKYPIVDPEIISFVGENINQINENMIGMRGKDQIELVNNLMLDMNKIRDHFQRIVKKDGKIILLVCDEYLFPNREIMQFSNIVEDIFKESFTLDKKLSYKLKGINRKLNEVIHYYTV